MIEIRTVQLPLEGFAKLQVEAREEQVAFLDRLEAEWQSERNRFEGAGEILMGAFVADELVGVCGLNIDPYANDPSIGRLRHLYVTEKARRHGVGAALGNAILEQAKGVFRTVNVRTDPDIRGRFYEGLGFSSVVSDTATHSIELR